MDDIKCANEDGSNGAGMRDDIKIGGADGTTIWEQDLGGDTIDAESVGGFPSSNYTLTPAPP